MAGGAGFSSAGCEEGVFSTSQAEELTGPEHRGEAAGGGARAPNGVSSFSASTQSSPSSPALGVGFEGASSDPPASAFVTTHPRT